MAAPSMPGTAYVLFHHVMGETNGKRGVWAYVKGGMGGLTQALARRPRRWASRSAREAEVAQILVQGRRGDRRRPGQRRRVPRPRGGQQRRLPTHLQQADGPNDCCRRTFAEAIDRINYDSASLKINVALSELPNFTACPAREPGPQHRGTVHICPDQDYIERGLRRRQVRPAVGAARSWNARIPSVVDPTRRAARQASDVDVHPVRAVQAAGRQPGTSCSEQVRRPLLRPARTSTRRTSSSR